MISTTLVIPCYNEAERLPGGRFVAFAEQDPAVGFHFVDDGSRDDTAGMLEQLVAQRPAQLSWQRLPRNMGKAEAVRHGCQRILNDGITDVGYWDADLATPLEELASFQQVLHDEPEVEMVCGARVCLLGRRISRKPLRHYFGRVFATAASGVLGLPIYDTQCGAKLFRNTPRVRHAFEQPFRSRWLLDIEIMLRLKAWGQSHAGTRLDHLIYEVPLQVWEDVQGSKVKALDFPKSLLELYRLRKHYSK